MHAAANGTDLDDPSHHSRLALPSGDLWVFTYGSLMWDPGFEFLDCMPALLRGYHRAFCVYSERYRGTSDCPGLVLGLNPGGACRGTAYRVARVRVPDVLDLLWAREMPRRVYRPRVVAIRTPQARVRALTFLSDPAHRAYAGRLPVDTAAQIIAKARGLRGPNCEYLVNTLRHLDVLGVRDHHLHRLLDAVRALQK